MTAFKRLFLISLVLIIPALTGCAMCCSPQDYHYTTYGGKWDRGDRTWGRVGSNLSGAGVGDGGGVVYGQGHQGEVISSPTIYQDGQVMQYPEENIIQGGQYDYNPSPGVQVTPY